MGHPEKPLDQLIEINPQVKLEKGVAYPFIPMEEISPGRRYVKEKSYRVAGGGAKFCHGDTLFARITPCLENGKIAQYVSTPSQIAFGSTEYWVFRSRKGISDPAYVFYLANSEIIRKPAEKSMVGASGRQRADIKAVENVSVPAPTLPIQRRIASILSAYDDLIENNTRRIAILEEMARRIYEEWFVHFRFPGHEKVKMVDSELGKIPEGWKVVTIRDVTNYINRGISPKYEAQSPNIVINQKCIRNNKINLDLTRRHSTKVPGDKVIQFGDVLVNSTGIGTLGRVAQVYQKIQNYTVDSHVSIVRPNETVNIDYFGSFMSTLQSHFDSLGTGSTGQTELGRETISKAIFLFPPKKLQDIFGQTVSPMRRSIINLYIKNANLRTTRDFLLPKLISGEIDVSKLPEPEEAAA